MEPPRDADATATAHITVSGHQIDLGDGLKEFVIGHVEAMVSKYFGGAEDVAVTFSRTGNGGFGCSLRVRSGHNLYFDGGGENHDVRIAFNQALEHVAKQLRRRKRALREDKPVNPTKQGLL